MRYFNKNFNNDTSKLKERILNGINSAINDYTFLYNANELNTLAIYKEKIEKADINEVSKIEDDLKPLIFKTWQYEEEAGNNFISWLKNDIITDNKEIISSTFNGSNFCDSLIGIKYKVDVNGFIGACEKDAATVIETKDKSSIYTIKELSNDKVINSYNLATPIITPKQIFNFNENTYISKHNEVILDSRYVIPFEVVCLSDFSTYLASKISEKYNIPINFNYKNQKVK